MALARDMNIKPSCLAELRALPPNMASQVWEKIDFLCQDPLPDGNHKKKLTKWPDVYRLRIGDYRLFYSFGTTWIRLLGIRYRKDAYRREVEYEEPAYVPDTADDPDLDELLFQGAGSRPAWTPGQEVSPRALPRPITTEWLHSLGVPPEAHPALLACRSEDDLLNAAVESRNIERVIDNLFPRPIDEVMQQPDLAVFSTRDLDRYHKGDLIGFLLRLDPSQERLVDWALEGPALIKGGPGTGKSTVALYRVQRLIDHALKTGRPAPRILFTTYTPALARFSEQLLESLLGENRIHVTVKTADGVALDVVSRLEQVQVVSDRQDLEARMARLLERNRHRVPESISRLRPDYLLDEIEWVIEGRNLKTLDEYLAASRTGRGIALGEGARRAVWELYNAFNDELERDGLCSPSRLRARALEHVRAGRGGQRYDAVIIDEAQDLTPTTLSLLVELAESERGIYVTADSSQSIYFRGFSWQLVHERLKFRGRAKLLRRNYRSTREIAEAARSFLQKSGAGDPESLHTQSPLSGPMPVLATYDSDAGQWEQAADFIRQMTRYVRLNHGAAAVLVTSASIGQQAEEGLARAGLKAKFMRGSQLDLKTDAVKVLTLQAAKGLEFPVVVIAGLSGRNFPRLPADMNPEEREEEMHTARRALYVGMTRAMRCLVLMHPRKQASPFITELEEQYWARAGQQAEG